MNFGEVQLVFTRPPPSLVPRPHPLTRGRRARVASFPGLPRLRFDRLQYAKTELAQFLHTASDQKPEPGMAWERGYARAGHETSRRADVSRAQLLSKLESYWSTLYTQSIRSYVN